MKRYFLIKTSWFFATLFFVIVTVFVLMRATGIDPCRVPKAKQTFIQACRERWGLDEHIHVQLGRYLGNLATFDLGESYQHTGKRVSDLILEATPNTISIVLIAIVLSLIFGCAAGTVAAYRHGTLTDNLVMGGAMFGLAVPEVVIGPVLILLFALLWPIFPRSGLTSWTGYVLPVLALTLATTADIARLARRGMIEVLHQDYIRTARAKGLREHVVIFRHALRLGLTAVVSYLGPIVASFIAGGVFIIETLFGNAGLSYLFVDAMLNDPIDFPMILGSSIMLATLILVMNLLVDILYAVLNPRLRDDLTETSSGNDLKNSARAVGVLALLVIGLIFVGWGLVQLVDPLTAYADSITQRFRHTSLLLSFAWVGVGILLVRSYGRAREKTTAASLAQDAWRRLARNRAAIVSSIVLFALTLACLFLPWLMEIAFGVTFDFEDYDHISEAPPFMAWFGNTHAASWLHPFGTDDNGRDLFVRNLMGLRMSFAIGLSSLIVTVCIGTLFGTIAAYKGGAIDNVMMRFVDMLYAIPYLILVILLTKVVGRNALLLFIAIGFVSWLTLARVTRGEVLKVKQLEFVEAARAIGAPTRWIVTRHLIPNVLGLVIVYATRLMAVIILSEAFISFLGFGVQHPDASLGLLVRNGVVSMQSFWWLIAAPAITLALLLYTLNYLGDGLSDALDPKLRGVK